MLHLLFHIQDEDCKETKSWIYHGIFTSLTGDSVEP